MKKRTVMQMLQPGFYVHPEGNGQRLYVFKWVRSWYYVRTSEEFHPEQRASLFWKTPYWMQGYPTRAMAVSAAKGNRAS